VPYRTDLAMESHEILKQAKRADTIPGISAKEETYHGFTVSTVEVNDTIGAKAIGKPIGTYVTVTIDPLLQRQENAFPTACKVISKQLHKILPDRLRSCLVAGIGNPNITPDAVGPFTVKHIMVTRHIIDSMPAVFGHFLPVSAVSPGVLGMTGVETGELLKGIVSRVRSDCVIAVDALAARSVNRLCTTIQLSDTGIVPGSGIGNARCAIDRKTIGVPVIAIGVPTVVDAVTLAHDLIPHSDAAMHIPPQASQMMVTPREIDQRVSDVSKLIGYSINFALHNDLTMADMELFLS